MIAVTPPTSMIDVNGAITSSWSMKCAGPRPECMRLLRTRRCREKARHGSAPAALPSTPLHLPRGIANDALHTPPRDERQAGRIIGIRSLHVMNIGGLQVHEDRHHGEPTGMISGRIRARKMAIIQLHQAR